MDAEKEFFKQYQKGYESAGGTQEIRSLLDYSDRYLIFPGFCDVHVHFREPGFFYKETVKSGSMAAARGGYTSVCTMPNLNPVPDTLENLRKQTEIIDRDALIAVYPYASITKGEKGTVLSDMDDLAPFVAGFSDDGKGVQSPAMMEEAMIKAKALGKIIVAHCEDESLLRGGYIHDGAYAKSHEHKGICSESEWRPIARDMELVAKTGANYHICHVSAKESVEIIRQAKKSGLPVTAETAPHYLTLSDADLREEGRYKMNPPVRSEEDRLALLEGIKDGTLDMIATDHAPHSAEEKSRGLKDSPFGIVGLETAFPVLYTKLVKTGILTTEKLIDLIAVAPRKRFGLPFNGYCVWDTEYTFTVNPNEFLSMGRSTPYEGETLIGKCLLTVYNGKVAYKA